MARPDLIDRLARAHAERASRDLARSLHAQSREQAPWVVRDGVRLLDFSSNDYLGLASHAAVRDALVACAAREGVGATAAHLLGGHRREHAALEEALAEWTQRPRALLFSTGYMANLGVLGALLEREDLCVQDKLDHASLVDAALLAGCEHRRYLHADPESARRQLESRPDAAALLATDGVFSMDGDVAPLRDLAALCRAQGALLYVDDAHGIGVLGAEGRGSVAAAGLGLDDVPVLMATLGKALGVFGAFVAGSVALVEGLVQFARCHVYTTAMPPALAAAALAATQVARHEQWRRDKLTLLIAHLKRGARDRGLQLLASDTPIQPLHVGESGTALAISRLLREAGFLVPAIRPPTVPQGKARLRITLGALHTERQIEALLDALAAACAAHPPGAAAPAPGSATTPAAQRASAPGSGHDAKAGSPRAVSTD